VETPRFPLLMSMVMYLCGRDIEWASYYDCSIGYSDCSDSMTLFVFHFIRSDFIVNFYTNGLEAN